MWTKSSPLSSQVLKDSCCSLPLDNFRAYTDRFWLALTSLFASNGRGLTKKSGCGSARVTVIRAPLIEILCPPLVEVLFYTTMRHPWIPTPPVHTKTLHITSFWAPEFQSHCQQNLVQLIGTRTLCLRFLLWYALIPNTKPIMLIILCLLCSQLLVFCRLNTRQFVWKLAFMIALFWPFTFLCSE